MVPLSPLDERQAAEMQTVTAKIQSLIVSECQKLIKSMPQYVFDLKCQQTTLMTDYTTSPDGAWLVRVPANEATFNLTVTRQPEQPVIPCA